MDKREKQEPDLIAVLKKHFSPVSDAEAKNISDGLIGTFEAASALQEIESSDRDPKKDIKSLEKAVRALATAQMCIEQLGWYGQATLPVVLRETVPNPVDFGLIYPNSGAQAQEALAGLLASFGRNLKGAVLQIAPDAPSVNTAFGEGPDFEIRRNTKTVKTAAAFLARECGTAFFRLTGEHPTVSTDYSSTGNPAYGPFLDFVSDVFTECNVNASAETFARKAGKDFSDQN